MPKLDAFKIDNLVIDGMNDSITLEAGINVNVLTTTSDANVTETAYAKVIEARILCGGVITVNFAISINTTSATSTTGYGRIYVNGVAVGTARSLVCLQNTASSQTFSENITVKANDRVQIYGYKNTGTGTVKIKSGNIIQSKTPVLCEQIL